MNITYTQKSKLFFWMLLFFLNSFLYAQTGCWKQVAAGASQTVAIKKDGSLWSWGLNHVGQIGNGTFTNVSSPTQIGTATDWKEVYCRYFTVIALKNDGTLWGWGYNINGQAGVGSTNTNINVPMQIGTANDWKQASIGNIAATAIKNDGTLWGWGIGFYINGTMVGSNVPIQIETENLWKEVAVGYDCRYAIKNDGTLWAWGNNGSGLLGIGSTTPNQVYQAIQVGTSNNWKHISSSQGHTTAIQNDNTLWAWGINNKGQLGNGTTTLSMAPIQIGNGTDWIQTEAGHFHTVARKNDGTLWNWGENYAGELGNGTNVMSTVPIQVGTATDWVQASAGNGHTAAIRNDGSLWVYGLNTSRQLGTGSGNIYVPTALNCPTSLGSNEFNETSNFTLYPNPVRDFLSIQMPNDELVKKIIILDVSGKKILEQTENTTKINVSGFSKGLYLIQIYSNNRIQHDNFFKS